MLGLHRKWIERHAVRLHVCCANVANHAFQALQRVIQATEEIDVLRCACERRIPHVQHQRPLQNETLAVSGL